MKYRIGILLLGLAFTVPANAWSGFTAGNIVVTRFDGGGAALGSGKAATTYLDEYTPGGTLVNSTVMPITVASSGNRALTNAGTSSSEGHLNLSANGKYFVLAGYNAAPNTLGLTTSNAATLNRVIGRVTMRGIIDTTTALTDAYSTTGTITTNIRMVASDNGTNFWTTGTGGNNIGTRYTTLGGTASTQLHTALPTNVRTVNIFNGQLYVGAQSTNAGVYTVGTGLPTTSGQALTILPGFPAGTTPSYYDFAFGDASTLYVADDRTVATGGGLSKWVLSGGTWGLSYTLGSANGLTAGLRGLTLTKDGSGNNVLYATSADTLTKLVAVTDTGSGSMFTTIVTAATNTAFRGVEIVTIPEPATLALMALGGLALLRRR